MLLGEKVDGELRFLSSCAVFDYVQYFLIFIASENVFSRLALLCFLSFVCWLDEVETLSTHQAEALGSDGMSPHNCHIGKAGRRPLPPLELDSLQQRS